MAREQAIEKRYVSLLVKIETITKLDKMAKSKGLSRNELAAIFFDRGTQDVKLTSEDWDSILLQIKGNSEKRKRNRKA